MHEVDASAIAQAREDLAAGRYVSGESVKRWLRSWGKPDELPSPNVGD